MKCKEKQQRLRPGHHCSLRRVVWKADTNKTKKEVKKLTLEISRERVCSSLYTGPEVWCSPEKAGVAGVGEQGEQSMCVTQHGDGVAAVCEGAGWRRSVEIVYWIGCMAT